MTDKARMDALHLDGNAAAGLLEQIFSVDVTTAVAACLGCGASSALGSLMLYAHEMGAVLRCAGCGEVVVRATRTPTHVWLDARGARSIAIPVQQ